MADAAARTIIVLNGCPSVGKTSIAKAIQRTFEAPYLHVGIDLFWLQIFPWEWAGAATNSVQEIPIEGASPPKIMQTAQPFGNFVISGLHHTVAALAQMGHNVVVDHVLTDARYVADIVRVWQSFPVWLVGVFCPLETIHQRIAAQTDRDWPSYLPMTTWMFDEAHKHTWGIYDLEVDTSQLTPADCALQIKHMLTERGAPSAFKQLVSQ
ncbi:MAG TPA: AAA family ATPase [Roseiflexaceae bacterium]|nr:AAA family ATPase [Roseiflexaceae bacterium]